MSRTRVLFSCVFALFIVTICLKFNFEEAVTVQLSSPSVPVLATDSVDEKCDGYETDYPVVPYDTHLRMPTTMAEYAYVTLITKPYGVPFAISLFHSIAGTGSIHARCVLVASRISMEDRKRLALFAHVIEIDMLFAPFPLGHYDEELTKLRAWQLEPLFKKVVLIDYDMVVIHNIDDVFSIPVGENNLAMAATKDTTHDFMPNAGFLVLAPNLTLFDQMVVSINKDFTPKMKDYPSQRFLLHFFDEWYPKVLKERNIPVTPMDPLVTYLPRWYQICMVETGITEFNEKLLNQARQIMTVFDERVRTIHFIWGKPWKDSWPDPFMPPNFNRSALTPDTTIVTEAEATMPFSDVKRLALKRRPKYSLAFCWWKEYARRFIPQSNQRSVFLSFDGRSSKHHKTSGYGIKTEVESYRQNRQLETIKNEAAPTGGSVKKLLISDEELKVRVEPVSRNVAFWFHLSNVRSARELNRFLALRQKKPQWHLDEEQAKASRTFNPQTLDPSVTPEWTKLRTIMSKNPGDISAPYERTAAFRTQLVLGEAWGFNDQYQTRNTFNKTFSPLRIESGSLNLLLDNWKEFNKQGQRWLML